MALDPSPTPRCWPSKAGIRSQPQSPPISQERLAAEVKGIYAGLVMVEAKCISIDSAKAANPQDPLGPEHWQALVALHRTLLYEHHDFLMATQHPSANKAFRGLASKYSMPARMWNHGIHAFLEVLRQRRPDSQEYMLSFVYLAYQMMALLSETVPGFRDTWIECLGDLARYRMAIEEEKEAHTTWGSVARRWYTVAADRHPTVGRLYHHLGILERPSLRKFQCYASSLNSLDPRTSTESGESQFHAEREKLATLCTPVLGSVPDPHDTQSSPVGIALQNPLDGATARTSVVRNDRADRHHFVAFHATTTPITTCALNGVFPAEEPPLPEDYLVRGLVWAHWYFAPGWFAHDGGGIDTDRPDGSQTESARTQPLHQLLMERCLDACSNLGLGCWARLWLRLSCAHYSVNANTFRSKSLNWRDLGVLVALVQFHGASATTLPPPNHRNATQTTLEAVQDAFPDILKRNAGAISALLISFGLISTLYVCIRPRSHTRLPPSRLTLLAVTAGFCFYVLGATENDSAVQWLVISVWVCLLGPAVAGFAKNVRNPMVFLSAVAAPVLLTTLHLAASGSSDSQVAQYVCTWGPTALPVWAGAAYLCQTGYEDRHRTEEDDDAGCDAASCPQSSPERANWLAWLSRFNGWLRVRDDSQDPERGEAAAVSSAHDGSTRPSVDAGLSPESPSIARECSSAQTDPGDNVLFGLADDSDGTSV